MKKRLVSLLLAVCMLFCVSSVAFAYDYSIDGSYQVEYRSTIMAIKLWDIYGSLAVRRLQWNTSGQLPRLIHMNTPGCSM